MSSDTTATRQAWRSRVDDLWRRRRASRRQAKGAAELSVAVVVVSLVAGVLFGDGMSRTAVDIADGLTWLGDDPSGEVVQVNPATGQAEVRLEVAADGHDLTLAQYDDHLYVIDNTDGVMSSIDVGTLIRSGQRRVPTGGAAETLSDGSAVFLVDRAAGKIATIDPITGDEIGRVWREPEGLADAAVDDAGTLWSLDQAGRLTSMRWSSTSLAFVEDDTRQIDHSGPRSVVVAHEEGVTVFGPDAGIVHRAGTDQDLAAASADLMGELRAPLRTPAALSAVAAPDFSTVVVLAGTTVTEADVAAVGCARPGRPEVFGEHVFVPCEGSAQVIRLDAAGRQAGPAIPTPGSADPELVLDDDNLLINVPGASTGVLVDEDGSTKKFARRGKEVASIKSEAQQSMPIRTTTPEEEEEEEVEQLEAPPETPETLPSSPMPPVETGTPEKPGKKPGKKPGRNTFQGNGGEEETPTPTSVPTPTSLPVPTSLPTPTSLPSPTSLPPRGPTSSPTPTTPTPTTPTPTTPTPTTPTPTTPTPTPTPSAPTGVRASVVSSTQVQVDWSYSGDTPDDFVISRAGGGNLTTVSASQRQAVVTVTPGQSVSFVVTARLGGDSAASRASNVVTPSGVPGRPANVQATGQYGGNWKFPWYRVTATWEAAPANGAAITGYRVTISTGTQSQTLTLGADERTYSLQSSCPAWEDPMCDPGGDGSVSVTAINADGPGPTVSVGANDSGTQPVEPLPGGGTDHVTGESIDWDGPAYEGFGTLHVSLSPPADWAAFTGTCSFTASGAGVRSGSGSIPCSATGVDIPVSHGTVRSGDGSMVTHHYSIRFTASNAGGSVDSATHYGTYRGGSLCRTCPIP